MLLNKLYVPYGATKKRKRRGRGVGSGHGKTSCRGSKGLFSRAGGKLRHGFEGGQMPLIRRIPKRGFARKKDNIYQVVNIESLKIIKGKDAISPEDLKGSGLVKNATRLIKILGNGELSGPVTVRSHAFSASAKAKIEKAGGKAEVIGKSEKSLPADKKTKRKT
ncbi:50S ribosomal protein L15 [Omnitrophica bacterium]|nr:50S ribosomal protein L15 [Candidatus Omnitrophota bacterium]